MSRYTILSSLSSCELPCPTILTTPTDTIQIRLPLRRHLRLHRTQTPQPPLPFQQNSPLLIPDQARLRGRRDRPSLYLRCHAVPEGLRSERRHRVDRRLLLRILHVDVRLRLLLGAEEEGKGDEAGEERTPGRGRS